MAAGKILRAISAGALAVLSAAGLMGASASGNQSRDIRTGIFRGRAVTYEMVGGRPIFEGDVILDHVRRMARPPRGGATPGTGIAYPQYFWPKNDSGVAQIPYVVTNGSGNLASALSRFNAAFAGIIQFTPRGSEADYVDFDLDSGNHNGTCESNVGHVGGQQVVGGSIDCNIGTLLHEMGHVVGLYHEQSRSDRNTFVTVSYAAMIKGSKPNFDQVFDNDQNVTLYDYRSVMHYLAFAFSRNGEPVIESIPAGIPLSNTDGYTEADIDSVKRLYGAAPTAVTVASNPPGLTVTVDGVNTTTPHVFSGKFASQHTLAVPSGGQMLNGLGYVYGRWNDSTDASHTITITRGNRTLAKPFTSPAVTVYTANFIQLVSYTAVANPVGAGGIAANPAPQSYPGLDGVYYVERQPVTLTATANAGYGFLRWDGIPAPWGANPKSGYAPEGGNYVITANFSSRPITTITTNPAGLGVTVDGVFWLGPQKFADDFYSSWTPNSVHSVSTSSPQRPYSINSRDVFTSWSDNGALTHNITATVSAKTVTARFTPEFVPVAYATPSCAATVSLSPTSADGFYAKGTVIQVTSAPASGWTFTGWLDDLHGTTNPQNLTVNDEKLAVANYNTTSTPLAVTSLKPALLRAGSEEQTLQIVGKGFSAGSIVFVNNAYRVSQYISPTLIDVTLTADDLTTPGAFPVAVSNFPSGAPCSAYAARTFLVASP